jgi:hypothetical protein
MKNSSASREPRRPGVGWDQITKEMAAPLRTELADLREREPKVREALQSEEAAEAFASQPLEFLARLEVKTGPALRQRLREQAANLEALKGGEYLLPDGGTLRPKIRVRVRG